MRWCLVVGLLVVAALAVALTAVPGCAEPERSSVDEAALAGIRPETRERMQLVMDKIGQYYVRLSEHVESGNLAAVPPPADAIATLGGLLAPHRDPGMPPEYVALQARFDEAARELAAAARLKNLQEVAALHREMRKTCRNCHATFRVSLAEPFRDLGHDASPQE